MVPSNNYALTSCHGNAWFHTSSSSLLTHRNVSPAPWPLFWCTTKQIMSFRTVGFPNMESGRVLGSNDLFQGHSWSPQPSALSAGAAWGGTAHLWGVTVNQSGGQSRWFKWHPIPRTSLRCTRLIRQPKYSLLPLCQSTTELFLASVPSHGFFLAINGIAAPHLKQRRGPPTLPSSLGNLALRDWERIMG